MKLYTLKNNNIKVDISPLGATIVNFFVTDAAGKETNIVLGYDNEQQYRKNSTYFGAVVGPVANRIDMGEFELDGKKYALTQNDGTNHLHGGNAELNNKDWDVLENNDKSIILTTYTNQGEGGYPCGIIFQVSYFLSSTGELEIRYKATPTSRCPINVTQHAYFNLNGGGDILEHSMRINADRYLPVNEKLIPIGFSDVQGTPFDFRKPTLIGESLVKNHNQLKIAGGFDHCWELNDEDWSMSVHSDITNILLEVKTDLPGVQFYSGNFLEEERGRNGEVYRKNNGLCLETQHFPNQINTKKAEECVYDSANPFVSTTVFKVTA